MTGFDRRLIPARADMAAAHLRGVVEATRFVDGRRFRVARGCADLRAEPRPDCPLDTQALFGETAMVYDTDEGYAFVQLDRDGYVGWLPEAALGPMGPKTTHHVAALRTLLFPGPDLKAPILDQLPQGALLTVVDTVERGGLVYAVLENGTATVAKHLVAIDAPPAGDPVEVAEAYIGTPYLWGGRTSLGVDCSGLLQTAFAMAGLDLPRDTDMQEAAAIGRAVDTGEPDKWRRGDLVFWRGHVAIVSGPDRLLHANGFHMATIEEPLLGAVARIAEAGLPVSSVRRPMMSGV